MASFDFGIKINATDGASSVLSNIQQKISGMGASASKALAGASGAANSGMDRMAKFGMATMGIQSAAGALEGFSKGFVELDTATQMMKTLGEDGAKLAPILKNTAISMAKDIPFAASEIQGAMTDALASGIQPTEAGLSGFANTAAKLAAGSGTALGVVVKGLAGTLNAYGASASEATKYADIFFDINNAGVTSIAELNSYMPALNASANALGLSFADAGRSIALMTQKGVSTADASTQIKSLFTELAKPSADFQKFMKAAGISMNQLQTGGLEDRLKVIRAGMDKTGIKADKMFGSSEAATSVKVMLGDMKKMGEVFASVNDKGSGSSGNAFKEMQQSVAVRTKQMEARIDAFKIEALNSMGGLGVGIVSATSQLGKMSGEITALASLKSIVPEGAFKAVGSTATAAFTSLSSVAASGIGAVQGQMGRFATAMRGISFGGAFNSLRTGAVSAVSGMSTALTTGVSSLRTFAAQQLIAARGSALFSTGVTGFFRTLGGGLVQGLGSALKGIWSLNTAFLTSPVTWIALGIAGAAFLIYKNWDTIVAYFQGMFKGFSEALYPVKQAWDGIMTAIQPLVDGIMKLFTPTQKAGGALTSIGYAGEAAGKVIASVFNTIVPPILWVIKSVLSGVSVFLGFQQAGSNAAKVVAGALNLIFAPILAIKGLLGGLGTFFTEIFSGVSLYDAGANLMKSLWEGIKGWFGNLMDGVKGIVGGITNLFSGKKENPALRASAVVKEQAEAVKPVEKSGEAERKTMTEEAKKTKKHKDGKAKEKLMALNAALKPDFSWIAKQTIEPPKIKPLDAPKIKPMTEALKSMDISGTDVYSENSRTFTPPPAPELPSVQMPKLPNLGEGLKLPNFGAIKLPDIGSAMEKVTAGVKMPKMNLTDIAVPDFGVPQKLTSAVQGAGNAAKAIAPVTEKTVTAPMPARQATNGAVNVTFSVGGIHLGDKVNESSTPADIANEIQKALKGLAPELARTVEEAMQQGKRLEFAGF